MHIGLRIWACKGDWFSCVRLYPVGYGHLLTEDGIGVKVLRRILVEGIALLVIKERKIVT